MIICILERGARLRTEASEKSRELFESRERCSGFFVLSVRFQCSCCSGKLWVILVPAFPCDCVRARFHIAIGRSGDPRRRKDRQLWGGPGARVGRYHPRLSAPRDEEAHRDPAGHRSRRGSEWLPGPIQSGFSAAVSRVMPAGEVSRFSWRFLAWNAKSRFHSTR